MTAGLVEPLSRECQVCDFHINADDEWAPLAPIPPEDTDLVFWLLSWEWALCTLNSILKPGSDGAEHTDAQ